MWTLSFPARQTEEREKPERAALQKPFAVWPTERRDLPIAVVSEVMSSEFYRVLRIPLPTKQNKTKNPQLHAEILFRCLDGIRYPIALCKTFLLCVPGGKCNCDGRSLERLLSVHAHTPLLSPVDTYSCYLNTGVISWDSFFGITALVTSDSNCIYIYIKLFFCSLIHWCFQISNPAVLM